MRYRITETRQAIVDTDEWPDADLDDADDLATVLESLRPEEWDTIDCQVEPLRPVPNRFSDDEVDLMFQRSRDFVE